MWIRDTCIKPNVIKRPTTIYIDGKDEDTIVSHFPALTIGIDSYMWNSVIQSEAFSKPDICHNLQIGNYCSIGYSVDFMLDRNHDYLSITTSAASFLDPIQYNKSWKTKRKGQILIENDVWVGNDVTIMPGVTIHNGAVIAAESVVTKDVPPYAVVGGNPANVIKYRFSQEQIDKLEVIRWWEWSQEKLLENREWFTKEISEFTENFYDEAVDMKNNVIDLKFERKSKTFLVIPDFEDEYPVWKRVVSEYCKSHKDNSDGRLLIYIPESDHIKTQITSLQEVVSNYPENIDIYVYIDILSDERSIFKKADAFITTRNVKTVYWVGCAEQYGLRIISGVDVPIF
jgi:virginiamycin A acetyltransferase